jgi:adenylate cyclase
MQPPPAEPTNDETVGALNRVLGSKVFDGAGRARDFLAFIVQETLGGRGGRLKGYAIAVQVFERPADFDAQTDPLVRVEAGRLRRRLAEYYQGEGRDDPLRIELPRGGYTPVFLRHPAQTATAAPVMRATPASPSSFWWRAAAVTVALLAIGVGIGWMFAAGKITSGQAANPGSAANAGLGHGPRLVVLPLATLGEGTGPGFARGVTDEIIDSLVRFNIFATASPAAQSLEPASLASLRHDYHAGYALSGAVRADNGRTRVTVRLTDTEFGTQLWTWAFEDDVSGTGLLASQENIGGSIGTIVSSPFGPVFAQEIDRIAGKATSELTPFECLLRFYDYIRAYSPAGHADVTACMERSVQRVPTFAQGWSSLAVLYLHEYTFGYDPRADLEPPLDRALNAVRRSLDLDGSGRVAAVSLASVRLATGNQQAFNDAVQRALAMKPAHPGVLAQIGFLLILSGDSKRGAELIDGALPFAVHVPAWHYAAFALRYLETQQYEEAMHWALKVDAPNWWVAPMIVAASAELAGRHDIAMREAKRLLELEPRFATRGPELLRRLHMNDPLLDAVLKGLRGAGLNVS